MDGGDGGIGEESIIHILLLLNLLLVFILL
jgi:hypothetical protein